MLISVLLLWNLIFCSKQKNVFCNGKRAALHREFFEMNNATNFFFMVEAGKLVLSLVEPRSTDQQGLHVPARDISK